LLFLYLKDAYSIERKLYSLFSGYTVFRRYSSLKHVPLHKNGHAARYAKASLGDAYSEEQ
jgi:hypothetical protein